MRLIQISVTSVWLLRAVEMDFARGKIRNRWLMMGILLGVVLWIPGMKLLCVVGCLNGSRDIIYCICISFLLAAGFSFGRLLNRKQFRTSMRSCIQYFRRIAALGKIVSYDGRKVPGHQIHFSAFILLGYAAVLGVNLCKFIPL